MDSEDKKKLTPFAEARLNVRKTAENFNFYNSVEMLAFALNNLNKIDDSEGEDDLEKVCQNIIKDLSLFMQEKDDTWN